MRVIIINGPMGVGKTVTGKLIADKNPGTAFIDGDWCMDIHPFVGNRETKAMAIDNSPAVFVRPVIERRGDEPAQEKEVGRVDLHPVEACFFGPYRGFDEPADHQTDLIGRHPVRLHLQGSTVRLAVKCTKSELGDRRAAFTVDHVRQLSVLRDEAVIAKAHHAFKIAVLRYSRRAVPSNDTGCG